MINNNPSRSPLLFFASFQHNFVGTFFRSCNEKYIHISVAKQTWDGKT